MLFLFGNFALDSECRELRADGRVIPVEPQVFDVLVYLIENRHRVVSKDDLIASVWGGRIVSESTLTSRINAVRKAVGDSGEKQDFVRTFARKGVRWVAPVDIKGNETKAENARVNIPLAIPQKPSIAVLPFSNLSGDPDHDPFVDGVTEEIITALSRVRWFFVIARGSAFAYKSRDIDPHEIARELGVRYILMGSVRRAGDRIRVAAQLIDCSSRSNVWARSYDRALSDIFSVQDEITQTIVGGIEPELGRAERERARVKHRDSIDAWSIYQRGMFHLYRYTQNDLAQARKLFEDAIAVDPELGPAYSAIAEAYYYEVVYGFAKSPSRNREKAIELRAECRRAGSRRCRSALHPGTNPLSLPGIRCGNLRTRARIGSQPEFGTCALRAWCRIRIFWKAKRRFSTSGIGHPTEPARPKYGLVPCAHR